MRKLEGVVKEIVDEMEYLKAREERFQSTNSAYTRSYEAGPPLTCARRSVDAGSRAKLRMVHDCISNHAGCLADLPPARVLQAQVSHRLVGVLGIGFNAHRIVILFRSVCTCAVVRLRSESVGNGPHPGPSWSNTALAQSLLPVYSDYSRIGPGADQ